MIGTLTSISAAAFWVWLVEHLSGRYFAVPEGDEAVHYAATRDGWRLALGRYLPPVRRFLEPVVLCHGLGSNRYNLDFNEEWSLARYLRRRGFECWVIELRGCGRSERLRFPFIKDHRFNFDTYLQHDVPAILDHVRSVSGAREVLWVGHSMGGIVSYAYTGLTVSHGIRGAVAISSPFRFAADDLMRFILRFSHFMRLFPAIHQGFWGRLFAPITGYLHWGPINFFVNMSNIPAPAVRRIMSNVLGDIARPLLLQFMDWIEHRRFVSADGATDYAKNFARVATPYCLVAGAADRLVPPEAVRAAYETLGASDKTFKVFGRAHGGRADYGHGDIVLSPAAVEEVFPFVAGWLEERATPGG